MKRLFTVAGVDYVQWRALSRANILGDFAALFGAYGHAESRRAALDLLIQVVGFTMVGALPAVIVWMSPDPLLGAAVTVAATGLVATLAVIALASVFVTADDHAIVGFRPVSSRTYFAVRITGIVTQVCAIAVLTGYLPVISFLLKPGGSWAATFALAMGIAACALTATAGVLVVYRVLLQVVPAARVLRAVTTVQMFAPAVVMGLYSYAAFRVFDSAGPDYAVSSLATTTLPRTWWVFAMPPMWFASYVEIARGGVATAAWTAAALSVASLAGLVLMLRGLASSYAARIATTIDLAVPGSTPMRSWGAFRDERRALLILTISQLRSDLAVQTSAFMTVAFGAAIAASGFFTGWPEDPFWDVSTSVSPAGAASLALFMIPTSVRDTFVTSTAYEASWILFSTPADRVRLVTASRDAAAALLLVPTLLILCGIFGYAFGHLGHALLFTVFLGAASYVVLQFAVFVSPTVPFSVPAQRRSGMWVQLRSFLLLAPLTLAAMLLQSVAFRSPVRYMLSLLALIAVSFGINVLTRRRIAKRAGKLGYAG